ncbi:MAG: DUF4394 domain-containing protein, partial [Gemmataceae bacterium]|nr:DUF4394 domain-containing protein [Gemmataceae bacterium]
AGGLPAVGLSADGTQLVRFTTGAPAGAAAAVTVSGLETNEVLVGVDFRPATGGLYGLAVDEANDAATLYLIDPRTGAATAVAGATAQVGFVQADGTTVVDLPAASAGYGFDFNPANGFVRVTTGTGLNFRVDPDAGTPVDAEPDAGDPDGPQADPNVSGLPGGSTGVTGAAYTTGSNAGAATTTLYVLDAGSDSLFVQGATAPPGPNGGVLTGQVPVLLNGNPLDFTAVNGFDIPAGVGTDASGAAVAGAGYALLTVGTTTSLYRIDLTTGVATDLTAPAGLTGGGGLAVGQAPTGTAGVDAGPFTVNEGAGTATVTLTRTDGGVGALTVTVSVTGGTATAGTDFGTVPATVTFADGQTTANLVIPITDDTDAEPSETITLAIAAPTNGGLLGTATTGMVTILDNEPATVAFDGATSTVAEDVAGGTVTIRLVRTGDLSAAVDATVAVDAASTATNPADFTGTFPATVSFAAGAAEAFLTVPIVNDAVFDAGETVVLTVTGVSGGGAVGAVATNTLTITDASDDPGTIAFSGPTFTVTETGTNATITVTRTGGGTTPAAVDVTVNVTGGTATAGTDFGGTFPATVTLAAGAAEATFTIPITDDALPEDPDETVELTITGVSAGAIGTQNTATLTITDAEDSPGAFAFSGPTFTVTETGTEATITVTRTGGTAGAADVTVNVTGGTATNPADFGGTFPVTVSFADGDTQATFTIPVSTDLLTEGDETVDLQVTGVSAGTIGAQSTATLTITDVPPGQIAFTTGTFTVAEGGGQIVVTLTRTGDTTGAATVDVTITGGTATAGNDFDGAAFPVTVPFAAGADTATVTIPITQDEEVENPDETIELTLANATGAVLGAQATATVTIEDPEDVAGTIQFSPESAAVTVDEGGTATLTLTRTDGSTGEVTVTVTVTGGSATAADFDGTGFPLTVTFAAGATSATVALPALTDAVSGEGAETVVLTIAAPTGQAVLGTQTTATVTINDTTAPAATIAFDAATGTVAEDVAGGSATITLTRTGDTTAAASVTATVTGGTAVAGTDFTGTTFTVDFPAGSATATLSIPVVNNPARTGPRTVELALSNPTGAGLGTQTTTAVTITDTTRDVDALVVVGGQPNGGAQTYRVGADGKLTAVGGPATPFPGFAGTVRSTTGDVDGDGTPDTIYVTGPGTPIRMTVISGADNKTVLAPSSAPFSGSEDFAGGGFVTAADVDGDGKAEWAVTADEGGGARVTIFGLTGAANAVTVRANFLGIDDDKFRGGSRSAFGDVNGDGTPDLAVAAGFLGGPRAALFDGKSLLGANRVVDTPTRLVDDFFAFPGPDAETLRNGAYVTIGDLDGDGFGELIFGGGPGGAPRVFILDGELVAGKKVAAAQAAPVRNFFVGGDNQDRGGVQLAVADADGDGRADLTVGSGEGRPGRLRTYPGSSFATGTAAAEPTPFADLTPFGTDPLTDGIFIG